jgi:hypothetical protein
VWLPQLSYGFGLPRTILEIILAIAVPLGLLGSLMIRYCMADRGGDRAINYHALNTKDLHFINGLGHGQVPAFLFCMCFDFDPLNINLHSFVSHSISSTSSEFASSPLPTEMGF